MAFPTFSQSVIVTTFTGSPTDHLTELPATTDPGGLLLVGICLEGVGGLDDLIVPEELRTLVDFDGVVSVSGVYAKETDGTEGGTFLNFQTDEGSNGVAHVYYVPPGSWYGSIADGVSLSFETGGGSNPNPPALSPPWGEAENLWMMWILNADDSETVSEWPSNYGANGTTTGSNTGNNNSASTSSSWRILNAATENPGEAELTGSDEFLTVTLAIRPMGTDTLISVPKGVLSVEGGADVFTASFIQSPVSQLFLRGNAPSLDTGSIILVPMGSLSRNPLSVLARSGASAVVPLGLLSIEGGSVFVDTRPLWSVSRELREEAWAQASDLPLVLLTISHEDISPPIRVVNNKIDVSSQGETFVAFPFMISLPDNVENAAPRAQLVIDNVTREVIRAIRLISTPPDVMIQVIRQDAPDHVEVEYKNMRMVNIQADALTVTGDIIFKDFATEPYPAYIFSPGDYRGLVR